jgi:hypothetical protein
MRIGIHQPNFLPWMGYFHKIALSDTFVFLDHVEYTKNSYTKRVKIHTPNDFSKDQYLTVPLQKHSDYIAISSLQIANNINWQKKMVAKIYETYHKAPFYHQIEPLISIFFTPPINHTSFSSFNIEVIKYISELLELQPQWLLSSEMNIPSTCKDVNIEIATRLKGTSYLSGLGGKKYQDESLFLERNMQLEYSDYPAKFKELDIPIHFLNKSILSYLAYFHFDVLKEL